MVRTGFLELLVRPLKMAFLVICFAVLPLIGCGRGDGAGRRTLIATDGSSTVYPITEAVSEEFQLEHPRVMITAGRSGTGGGFGRFCRGETDLSAASRPILEREASQCAGAGIDYLELPVALDGVSVTVNRQNDFVRCLTVEELRAIWRPGSRVRTWRDVRPEFPGEEVRLYGPGTDSGTYDTFTEVIVGEVGASRADFQASEDDNVLVQGIIGDRQALGFFGYAYLDHNRGQLKVVGIDGGQGCVLPTMRTIRDGSYFPLSRPLFIYVKLSSLEKPGFQDFLVYFMTHAEELIPETGLLPVSPEQYRRNLELLAAAAGVPPSLTGDRDGEEWSGG